MALKRTIYEKLLAWKREGSGQALLITGARQVGKTFTIREFGNANYDAFLEINFVETPSAMSIFEGDLDATTLITALTAFSDKPLPPHRTLVFFDEIQECPRARTAIKFLVEDGRFDYIESGSLLGVSYKDVPSYPVGYERQLRMFPLTLEEFAWAEGVQPETLDQAKACVLDGKSVPPAAHERLMKVFARYMLVGGMPAAVDAFEQTQDANRVQGIQRSILDLYRQDIAKYSKDKAHIHAIFDAIPAELDKKNKRFKLSDLAKSARMERYASDFMWLADAGVALPCYNVDAPVVPLSVNTRHNLFKLFLCDTGLLSAQSMGDIKLRLIQGDMSMNWGSFLENAIAQELTAKGARLHYFDKQKYGEIDFLVESDHGVLPVEAKSGAGYRAHRSLDKVLAVQEWDIRQGVVLAKCNVEDAGQVRYLPWYAMAFLV